MEGVTYSKHMYRDMLDLPGVHQKRRASNLSDIYLTMLSPLGAQMLGQFPNYMHDHALVWVYMEFMGRVRFYFRVYIIHTPTCEPNTQKIY